MVAHLGQGLGQPGLLDGLVAQGSVIPGPHPGFYLEGCRQQLGEAWPRLHIQVKVKVL